MLHLVEGRLDKDTEEDQVIEPVLSDTDGIMTEFSYVIKGQSRKNTGSDPLSAFGKYGVRKSHALTLRYMEPAKWARLRERR